VTELAPTPAPSLLDAWPYAGFLGVGAEIDGAALITVLPFSEDLIGNTVLPALHGGVVGAFLELTALAQLSHVTGGATPRTVDITIDYLRPARAVTTRASAQIIRLGRRVANVHAVAWQSGPSQPVATLRGHFLVGGHAG
jgi:uncharacterized protein (TIGR00369 family)